MKRGLALAVLASIFLILPLLILPSVSALSFQATKINDVAAQELSIPAKFSLTLSNYATVDDYVEIYTLVDINLAPKGAIKLAAGETKTVELDVYPSEKLKQERRGAYTFVYYIKSQVSGIQESRLVIKILPLKDIIELETPEAINFDTAQIPVTFRNNESIALSKISVSVEAPFMSLSQDFSLNSLEEKSMGINIDNSKLKTLVAGKYIATFKFIVNDEASFKIDREITVSATSNIATEETDSGNWLYPIKVIKKTNNGNTIAIAEIIVKKGFIAKFLTSFSINPDSIKRATSNTYEWGISLKPGESVILEVKTNYLLIFFIFLAIIVTAVLLFIFSRKKVILKKKVLRVRTKGGEFAFKAIVLIKAREDVTNVVIKDRLPKLTELHERFGTEGPTRIDTPRKMLEWEIPELKKGQEQVYSYIAYSKVSLLGRFELPKAHVSFTHNGKTKCALSNSTYLLSEEHSI